MKLKTTILLVLAGGLLLFAWAFATFLMRGGEVLIKRPYDSFRSGGTEITADENIVDAIVGLDFTFEPTPGLVAHFRGTGKTKFITSKHGDSECYSHCSLHLKGNLLQSIPASHFYVNLTQEEFYEQLLHEIRLRINQPEADITFIIPKFDFWGDGPNQLRKRSEK